MLEIAGLFCSLQIYILAMSYYDILMKNVNYWAFPGPVPEPAEGGGPGRVLLAEHPRLIEPCRSVTLERSDRAHGKSRHRNGGATPPNAEAGVECVVWGVE